MNGLIWRDIPRVMVFWGLVALFVAGCDVAIPALNLANVANVLSDALALSGTNSGAMALDSISKPEFAVSLAMGLGCLGVAFLVAFVLLHWIMIRLELRRLRLLVAGPADRGAFIAAYDTTYILSW